MKELRYQHVEDFLRDQTSTELSALIEQCRMDDEIQTLRMARAITMAFKVERKPSGIDDDEEVIDTTKPEFAEKFEGFTNVPGTKPAPQRAFRNTEIIMG